MTSKSPAASSPEQSLEKLTVVELKDLCRERGIQGFAHKSKARLLEMVAAASGTGAQPAAKAAAAPSAGKSSRSGAGRSESKKKPKGKATAPDKGQQEDLASLTIGQLKQLCKDQGIKGFTRKTKQQLLALIQSTGPSGSSNHQRAVDGEGKKKPASAVVDPSPVDGADADLVYSEDLDANADNLEGPFNGDAEETMIEVSDSLILEVLDRFDRIEALLQRIAEGSGS